MLGQEGEKRETKVTDYLCYFFSTSLRVYRETKWREKEINGVDFASSLS